MTRRDPRLSKDTAVLRSLTSYNNRRIKGDTSMMNRYGSRWVTFRRAKVRISR